MKYCYGCRTRIPRIGPGLCAECDKALSEVERIHESDDPRSRSPVAHRARSHFGVTRGGRWVTRPRQWNSDKELRALERALSAEPHNRGLLRRYVIERMRAGRLSSGLAQIIASFPPGLEDRLNETEDLLAILRSVVSPLSNEEITRMTHMDESDLDREGWSIFETDSPDHPPFEVQFLQDADSGDVLIQDYRADTGSRRERHEIGDLAAWWRVRSGAYMGSHFYLAVLAFLLMNESSAEYMSILRDWNLHTPIAERSDIDWPERELHLVKNLILGTPVDEEDMVPRSFECGKCGNRGLPSGESCGACGEPFCAHCEGINHPGHHQCVEDDEEDIDEDAEDEDD